MIRGEEKFIKKSMRQEEEEEKTSQLCFNFAFACNEIYDLRLILKARKHARSPSPTFFSPRAKI